MSISGQKLSRYGVIELGTSDYDFIYCKKESSSLKLNKHNEISIRSMKNYAILEILRKTDFTGYTTYRKNSRLILVVVRNLV